MLKVIFFLAPRRSGKTRHALSSMWTAYQRKMKSVYIAPDPQRKQVARDHFLYLDGVDKRLLVFQYVRERWDYWRGIPPPLVSFWDESLEGLDPRAVQEWLWHIPGNEHLMVIYESEWIRFSFHDGDDPRFGEFIPKQDQENEQSEDVWRTRVNVRLGGMPFEWMFVNVYTGEQSLQQLQLEDGSWLTTTAENSKSAGALTHGQSDDGS